LSRLRADDLSAAFGAVSTFNSYRAIDRFVS
jgi:hypothetical protein